LKRVPGKWAFQRVLELVWRLKISSIPPQAAPYMVSEYIMNTDRLRRFLANNYEEVIHYTVEDAFAESFQPVFAAAVPVRAST
jgi:hypothetical protein